MLPVKTTTTCAAGTTTTCASFDPGADGKIHWEYFATDGLTHRSGDIEATWDDSDGTVKYYDESTNDLPDYLTAPGACTLAKAASGTTNTNGDHKVKVTFTTLYGETEAGTASATVTVTGNDDIAVSAIPVSTDSNCTGRNLYMTEAGPGATYYLAKTIANNTATTSTIAIGDVALALEAAAPSANTSAEANTSDLVLSVDMSAALGSVRLRATTTSYAWTVKTQEVARII